MADGKEGEVSAKVRWKKSEKHRRIRRRESWAREEKEIKELEDRCRDVSCFYPSLHGGFRHAWKCANFFGTIQNITTW